MHYLVTGASQGLGRSITERLLESGASVSMFSRSIGELETLCNRYKKTAQYQSVDIANEDQIKKQLSAATENFGPINGLVNAAGIYGPFGSVTSVKSSDWIGAINTNLVGTFLMLKHSIPLFSETGGTFVALSGGGATKGMPNVSSYAASKAGVVRLVDSISKEELEKPVSIVAVAPGLMATKMFHQALNAPPEQIGIDFHNQMKSAADSGVDQKETATDLIEYLLMNDVSALSGRLISAPWDPWRQWMTLGKIPALSEDEFMLRRIVSF